MKYFVIAGEPSGDLHGSKLMQGIAAEDSDASFRFCGGDRMVEVGGKEGLVKHYKEMSFFGFANVLRNLKTIFSQIDECKRAIEQFAADVIILIDYPSFNMRIAKWAHKKGIKVYYYIAPKVWAWKEWRVKSIRKYVDKVYTIFPFETEYFNSKGIKTTFCGNPLVDDIAQMRLKLAPREQFIADNKLDNRPIVALLAGSRVAEIKENLPNMVAIAERFTDYQFVVTAVPWIDKALYDNYISGTNVKYLCNQTQQTLANAEAAIVTSGTATLETALMGIPEMVLYHIPKLYEVLRPYVLKIPFVSLVNINLGREAVREIVCAKVDIDAASAELRSILKGGDKREKMLADFAELSALIGSDGASQRFAKEIVKTLKVGSIN
ncbi:MAG: lipid-A-disaccharide synthase [Alistipes sp.]|nr:lipid-A-disaccharide synthase [Alistipes sp.]